MEMTTYSIGHTECAASPLPIKLCSRFIENRRRFGEGGGGVV